MRPWTVLSGTLRTERFGCFNGATALRPWTVSTSDASPGLLFLLQWGHGLAAVDGRHGPREHPLLARASMGPRPCGRGRAAGGSINLGTTLLQWGHGLAAVDGREPPRPRTRRRASMGPRPCGRGRSKGRGQAVYPGAASMGPRPCGRGRLVESEVRGPMLTSFNGATALRPWTALRPDCTHRTIRCFNGATALRPWTEPQPGSLYLQASASMGPRPCGRGRQPK